MQTSVDILNAGIIKRRLGEVAGQRELAVLDADDVLISPAQDYPGCKLICSPSLRSEFVYRVRTNTIVN